MAQQRDQNRDSRRHSGEHRGRNYRQSYTGQTGGQWGEEINDAPYHTGGGYIHTQTNYDQGNYDYSQPGDADYDQGGRYGHDRVNNERNYGHFRRQQSSYPSDYYSGRDYGDQGAGQAYGQGFGNRRNAAYDEASYRSGGSNEQSNYDRRQARNYGRPNYGGSGPYSRSNQPGFDHGSQYPNTRGQYQDTQGGYRNSGSSYEPYSYGAYGGTQEQYRGKGPKAYKRSDARIEEDVNDRLTDDPHIDASDIEVSVQNGDIILSGFVENRFAKRHAEDLVADASGVKNVENRLRVKDAGYNENQERSGNISSPKEEDDIATPPTRKKKGGAQQS